MAYSKTFTDLLGQMNMSVYQDDHKQTTWN